MDTEVTDAMVSAALDAWFGSVFWADTPEAEFYRRDMRHALAAALAAAPGGHGERG